MAAVITLIYPENNPKGRMLVQIGRDLHVKSECCGAPITRTGDMTDYQDLCDLCLTILGDNPDGWSSYVIGISDVTGVANVSRWNDWAIHWFGLDGFKIEVSD